MGRKRLFDELAAGDGVAPAGVSYYIKVPMSMSLRIERELHLRKVDRIRSKGARIETSASAFFRSAAATLLAECEGRRGLTAEDVVSAPEAPPTRKRKAGSGKVVKSAPRAKSATKGKSGIGLLNMRERIERHGGEFEFHSAPGMTRITAFIPNTHL